MLHTALFVYTVTKKLIIKLLILILIAIGAYNEKQLIVLKLFKLSEAVDASYLQSQGTH
jgi:hypothetical protein